MKKGKESKPHIGIYGRRNRGKSSLINALAGQDIAIVSDVAGTTTDPVKKTMEIPGIGPAILVDTAGLDDTGELGRKRIDRSMETLETVDLAILVTEKAVLEEDDRAFLERLRKKGVPFVIVNNKVDIQEVADTEVLRLADQEQAQVINVSAVSGEGREELIGALREVMPASAWQKTTLLGDLISYGDIVLLITPIDIEAPEGRMILPQVQAIRDILDNDAIAIVVKEREVDSLLRRLQPRPVLAVTDSQVFLKADASVPRDIPLTSFSIMLARFKGDFDNYLKGTPKIAELRDGDRILILESCTHHVSCDDIGRTKIPRWLSNYTGKKLEFDVVTGLSKVDRNIRDYALVIQCGGCVITRKQVINRVREAVEAGVPVTNYGMAIAWMHGIYERAVSPFTFLNSGEDVYL